MHMVSMGITVDIFFSAPRRSQGAPESLLQIRTKLLTSGCSSYWIIPYPSGSHPTKVQASAIGKNIKINSKKSQGTLHWRFFSLFLTLASSNYMTCGTVMVSVVFIAGETSRLFSLRTCSPEIQSHHWVFQDQRTCILKNNTPSGTCLRFLDFQVGLSMVQ